MVRVTAEHGEDQPRRGLWSAQTSEFLHVLNGQSQFITATLAIDLHQIIVFLHSIFQNENWQAVKSSLHTAQPLS